MRDSRDDCVVSVHLEVRSCDLVRIVVVVSELRGIQYWLVDSCLDVFWSSDYSRLWWSLDFCEVYWVI